MIGSKPHFATESLPRASDRRTGPPPPAANAPAATLLNAALLRACGGIGEPHLGDAKRAAPPPPPTGRPVTTGTPPPPGRCASRCRGAPPGVGVRVAPPSCAAAAHCTRRATCRGDLSAIGDTPTGTGDSARRAGGTKLAPALAVSAKGERPRSTELLLLGARLRGWRPGPLPVGCGPPPPPLMGSSAGIENGDWPRSRDEAWSGWNRPGACRGCWPRACGASPLGAPRGDWPFRAGASALGVVSRRESPSSSGRGGGSCALHSCCCRSASSSSRLRR